MTQTNTTIQRGGFWSSMPGILTAIATLVTAVVGGFLGYQQLKKDSASPAPSPPPSVHLTVDMAALPAVAASQPAIADPVDGCANGNEADCLTVLDMLTEGCGTGNMQACDLLYEVTPVGSDQEEFAATCGYRDDGENAGECQLVYG